MANTNEGQPLKLKVDINPNIVGKDKLEALMSDFEKFSEEREHLANMSEKWAKKDLEHYDALLKRLDKEFNINEKRIEQLKKEWSEKKKIRGSSAFKTLGKGVSGGFFDTLTEKNQLLSSLSKGPEAFGNLIGQKIYGALKKGADYLAGVFKDFEQIVKNSYLTSSKTRENAFSYGMTSAESFGFERAKDLLGIQNTEDLLYMNDTQSQKFRELMTKYTEQYSNLYDKGFFDKMLEFQIMQEDFKQDFEMKVMELFLNNKDLIMNALTAILEIAEWVMNALPNVSGASDNIINEINSKKISVDTTFNISGDVNKQTLINAGQQTVGLMEEQIYNLP